jgi:hypothetical protein
MTLMPWRPLEYTPVVQFRGWYSSFNKWLLIAALILLAVFLTPELYLKVSSTSVLVAALISLAVSLTPELYLKVTKSGVRQSQA